MAATVAPAGHICVLRSNGDDGNRIPLDASAAATVTFGRALTSDVRIALAHCSRLHAELRVDQNARVSLVNHAKAANATLLNAQPLAPKAARDVRDGDVFEICGKRFRFEASVLAATTTMASITEEENVTAEKRDVAKPLPSGLLQAITARRRSSVLGRPAKPPPPPPPPRAAPAAPSFSAELKAATDRRLAALEGAKPARPPGWRPPPPPPRAAAAPAPQDLAGELRAKLAARRARVASTGDRDSTAAAAPPARPFAAVLKARLLQQAGRKSLTAGEVLRKAEAAPEAAAPEPEPAAMEAEPAAPAEPTPLEPAAAAPEPEPAAEPAPMEEAEPVPAPAEAAEQPAAMETEPVAAAPEAEPAAEPAAAAPEPAAMETEPAVEPVAEPTAEPAAEPPAEPVAEPAAAEAEPVAEPTAAEAEPVAEPVAEPAAAATEPAAMETEPVAEPAVEPVATEAAPEPAAMETEPEAAEAEPSLSTQENSQDSLTDAAVGGLTQEESLGAEPVAAKPPRPSVRFAVEEAPPRPAVRFAASPAKARGVTFAPLAGATPSRSGGGLRRPTPFRPASADGPASPKAQAALAASPWARPKEETVRVDALPAGLRREVLDARQQDLVKAAVAAAARSWASVAKAPKAETEAEAAPSATDVLAAATAPVDDHTLTREGSRSIAALLEGADDEEAARKRRLKRARKRQSNPGDARAAMRRKEARRRRQSIAALPELGEVWDWLTALHETTETAAPKPEAVARVPELQEAWGWMESLEDPELRAAGAEAVRNSRKSLAAGDAAGAWRCLVGTGEFGGENRFAALYESSDDDEDDEVVELLADMEAAVAPEALAKVQENAQLLVDREMEPRLAYACVLDRHYGGNDTVDLGEAWSWLETLSKKDENARRAVEAANSENISVSDLAALASECSDKDKALIAQRAEDVAKAGVAYGPAFASALDSFAADPEGFAGRETNSNEVVEAAPAALEDAWAALESRDQARDRFNDDATDAGDDVADVEEIDEDAHVRDETPPEEDEPGDVTRIFREAFLRANAPDEAPDRRASALPALADALKQLEGVDSPAARAARRASVAGLSGLSDAWRWVDELDDELKEKALDAKRAALGAVPDVAAAWAAVEACEDPVLRRAAKELRRACSDDTTNVGEVLLWLTRAAEVAAADEEDVVIMEPAAPPSPVRTFDAAAARRACKKLTVPKLRAALAEKGLDTKGLKVALVERLVGALRAEATGEAPAAAEPAAPEASDAMEAEPAAPAAPEASDAMEAEPAFDEASATKAAKKLKVAELRAALEAAGADTKGLKAALVERLVGVQRAAAGGAPPAAPEASDATEAAPEAEEGFDEAAATRQAKKMKVAELRAALEAAGADTKGLKAALVERLVGVQRAAASGKRAAEPSDEAERSPKKSRRA